MHSTHINIAYPINYSLLSDHYLLVFLSSNFTQTFYVSVKIRTMDERDLAQHSLLDCRFNKSRNLGS